MAEKIELSEVGAINSILTDGSSVHSKDLPVLISKQIDELKSLDKSVKKALESADKAREAAESAKNMSAGLFRKKVAIEELQLAGVELAEAVQSGAETQKISFEFQNKLAEITKYLFGLGVSNIASNRFVVRELELRLKGASKEKLSELAKKELQSVIKQLKDQEDILVKQMMLTDNVKAHEEEIKQNKVKTSQIETELLKQSETDKYLEDKLIAQQELDRLHSEQIEAQAEVDKLHSEQIRLQAENEKRLAGKLLVQEEVDRIHTEQLELQKLTTEKNEKLLENQIKIDKIHDVQFELHLKRIQQNEDDTEILNRKIQNLQELTSESHVMIADLQNNILSIHQVLDKNGMQLENKTEKNYSKITLAIAIIALSISIIQLLV